MVRHSLAPALPKASLLVALLLVAPNPAIAGLNPTGDTFGQGAVLSEETPRVREVSDHTLQAPEATVTEDCLDPLDPSESDRSFWDWAFGGTIGFVYQVPVEGNPYKTLTVGAHIALMWFGYDGDIIAFLVTPKGGDGDVVDRATIEGRAEEALQNVGFQAGFSAGGEAADYFPGKRRTLPPWRTFEGVFDTYQGNWGGVGGSLYWGEPDCDGGRWKGGTVVGSLGAPAGAGRIGWEYRRWFHMRGEPRQRLGSALEAAVRTRVASAQSAGEVGSALASRMRAIRDDPATKERLERLMISGLQDALQRGDIVKAPAP